ncbi:hypothetical protein E2542_SST12859 [Spatholobus suberectus]|nr:hypothetical protein E2542_SST12859 [Spatholobus suberectus]
MSSVELYVATVYIANLEKIKADSSAVTFHMKFTPEFVAKALSWWLTKKSFVASLSSEGREERKRRQRERRHVGGAFCLRHNWQQQYKVARDVQPMAHKTRNAKAASEALGDRDREREREKHLRFSLAFL